MLSLTYLKVLCLSCFSFIKACFTDAKKCIYSKILSCRRKCFRINNCTAINSNKWLSVLCRVRKGVELLIYWDLWAVCLSILDVGVSLSNSRKMHPLSTVQTWGWHWENKFFFYNFTNANFNYFFSITKQKKSQGVGTQASPDAQIMLPVSQLWLESGRNIWVCLFLFALGFCYQLLML